MELLYNIGWPGINETSLGHGDIVACSWSSSNFFAFTTEKELNGCVLQYLHITNPNQPWDVWSTRYNGGAITSLQWDHTGTRLVSGDNHGLCCLWTMTSSLSNVWVRQDKHKIDLDGEEILSVGWLHNGARMIFLFDKMESMNISDKFDRSKFRPSVMQHGGKPMEGYIVVTGTGLVAVRLLLVGGESVESRFRLNVISHQQIADIAFTNQGKVVILTTDGEIQHFIQFHQIQLKFNTEEQQISHEVTALPSLQLRCASDNQSPYTHVSHAQFVSRENQDHVLVCVSGPSGSKFEGWLIRKENVQLHRVFQTGNPTVSPPESTKYWHYVVQSNHLPQVLNFSVPALPIDASSNEHKFSQEHKFFCGFCFAVALADNTIQILHRLVLQVLDTQHLPERSQPRQTSPGKAMKTSAPFLIRNVSFSTLSCAMIAADKHGNLLLYKVPPWLNAQNRINTLHSLKQLVQLLLYCLVSGKEWWEILLHISPNMVEPLVQRLTSEVGNQLPAVQQVLDLRLQALKISAYHITSSPLATDHHIKMLFQAIALVFRSLVRPHQQVGGEENDPAVKLQSISRTSMETNIDQLVQNVDTDPQTLQSMQQLIQWVADVALYLIASLPMHKQANRPATSLYWDREWLSMLREMLVVIRVWGLLKSACSPVFNVLDSKMDVLSHMFKLISQLWMANSDEHRMNDLPMSLKSECSMLPFHVVIPPLEPIPPPNSAISQLMNSNAPCSFTFGEAPQDNYVISARQQSMMHVAIPGSSGKIDSLRRTFLGKVPNQDLKECIRCGITTTCNNLLRTTLKVWDQRFVRSCVCGGHWKKVHSNNLSCV